MATLVQIPKPKRIIGPHELTLNGEIVKIEDRLAKLSLQPDEQLLMAHFNARATGHNIPEYAVAQYLSRFFSWKVSKLSFSYIELHERDIHFDDEDYSSTSSLPFGLSDALKDHVLKLPNFGRAYDFLTRGYLKVLGVLKRNETLLDRVSTMTLANSYAMVSFGCSGDCQPSLSYASPWSQLQDFIDFFNHVDSAEVRIGVCTKTRKPETAYVTTQEHKTEERPTGKMRTATSCS